MKLIETQRLILRPFKAGDEKDLFEYLHNPEVHCFFDMKIDSIEQAASEVLPAQKMNII